MSGWAGRIAAALLLAPPWAGAAGAQEAAFEGFPALYDVSGVTASDRLNVREKPDAKSAVAGSLAPDAVDVEVTGLSPDGTWARVNVDDRAGWVALRFLERQEQAPWWDAAVPLSCYGTEPFWGLKIGGGKAAFDSPEGPEDPQETGARAVIAAPGPKGEARLGLRIGEGFAVIRPAACSDGMSERANGLAIEFFKAGREGLSGLTGCCALIR